MKKENKKLVNLIKQFADFHGLVDFGALDKSDELEPIRGITLQADRKDKFYAHGNTHDREISLLVRQFSFDSSTKKDKDDYLWAVMRFELTVDDVNHIFVDAHHGDNKLYRHITEVVHNLAHVNAILEPINGSFTDYFHVFTQPQQAFQLTNYLNDPVLQAMYSFYQGISFELHGRFVYVYSDYKSVSDRQLKKMFEAGLWLSEQIEYADAAMRRHTENFKLSPAYI